MRTEPAAALGGGPSGACSVDHGCEGRIETALHCRTGAREVLIRRWSRAVGGESRCPRPDASLRCGSVRALRPGNHRIPSPRRRPDPPQPVCVRRFESQRGSFDQKSRCNGRSASLAHPCALLQALSMARSAAPHCRQFELKINIVCKESESLASRRTPGQNKYSLTIPDT